MLGNEKVLRFILLFIQPNPGLLCCSGPVLNAVIAPAGDRMFSCSTDGTIHSWLLPGANTDPYDPYETTVSVGVLREHRDAVWDLAYHATKPLLLSASADCTVKLWRPLEVEQDQQQTQGHGPLLNTFECLPGRNCHCIFSVNLLIPPPHRQIKI